jgi:hypothetical protein
MIVNLAVAYGDHAALRVRHWLVGLIRETTNGQARRTEDREVGVNLAGGVRPTVRQGFEHCLHSDMSAFARRDLRKGYIAADATHSRSFSELTVGYSNTTRLGFEPMRRGAAGQVPAIDDNVSLTVPRGQDNQMSSNTSLICRLRPYRSLEAERFGVRTLKQPVTLLDHLERSKRLLRVVVIV